MQSSATSASSGQKGKQILQDSGVNKLHRDVEKLQPEFNGDNVLEDPWEEAIDHGLKEYCSKGQVHPLIKYPGL